VGFKRSVQEALGNSEYPVPCTPIQGHNCYLAVEVGFSGSNILS
jgi:hypothetical protein